MTTTRWIIFAAICVIVLGALAIFSTRDNADVDDINEYSIVTEGPIPDHTKGSDDDKVLIIEYGDFQCPSCGNLYPILSEVMDHYKDELTLVYRNFPLTSIHPNALAAAAAAEAAGLQGEFFAMHDMLFENQASWSNASSDERTDIFREYAANLGLDAQQFVNDLGNDDVNTKIRLDQALGRKSGADSTPTVFLQGERVANDVWNDSEQFEQAIREALENAGYDDLPKPLSEEES